MISKIFMKRIKTTRVNSKVIRRVFSNWSTQGYDFRTGAPYAFENSTEIPKIQKGYNDLVFDPDEDYIEPNILNEVEFLFKVYLHSLSSGRCELLQGLVEERFAARVDNFVKDMKRIGVDLDLSDGGDLVTAKDDKLGRKINRARVKQRILELYEDIELDIQYKGSLEVYQVDIERINNLNFQNYDIEEQEPGLLRYKINKREIPEEYKAILRTKSDDMDSVLSQIDERYAQKKPQEDINTFAGSLLEKQGGDNSDTNPSEITDLSLLERILIGNFIEQPKGNFILVQEFEILSPLFIKIAKPDLDPLRNHTMRIERFLGPKESGSNAKYTKPILVDFDNFMRGNPHPNSPKIL